MENKKKPVCLVLEPTGVVAFDLSSMVEEALPCTTLVAVATEEEALRAMDQLLSVDVAFLNTPPTRFESSALGKALARVNALVVFLGYETEARQLGHRSLERPFLNRSVADVLNQYRDCLAASGLMQGRSPAE